MTIMSGLQRFLSLVLLFCVFASRFFMINTHVVGLSACSPSQIQALMEFKSEFDSSSCNHNDYVTNVECNNATGAVTKLQLPSGCLRGTLKPKSSLFRLHHLHHLNLSYNDFTSSSLPSGFGSFNRLEVLSLSSNGFIGQVPSSFSNLSQLSILDLSHNRLAGSFPLVGNLSKLYFLDLSYNHLTGTLNLNNDLFGLHQLRYLDLSYNNFGSSSFPSELGNANRLEVLALSSSGFIGQVPTSFGNLSRLTELHLSRDKLMGSFPLVQNLSKLSVLDLSHNNFSGAIPSSLFTMPLLSVLDLTNNHFNGTIEIPDASLSSRLECMFLGGNKFDEQILKPISKLINLKRLDLSSLNINYPIDLNFTSSLKALYHLDLSDNSVSPTSLSSDSGIPLSMKMLLLCGCNISEFPNILKPLQNLQLIEISSNNITGKVPPWFWSPPRLISVNLCDNSLNSFQGSTEVLVNSSVQMLDLSFNRFEGALPNLPLSIRGFSVVANNFTGDIPLSICNRSSLTYLVLSNNNFKGSIPQCLGKFKIVKLRKNNLEGSIPNMFDVGASLHTLDVGYNQLTGNIPKSFLNCSSLKFLSVDHNQIEDTFPFWLKALPDLQVLILRSNKLYGPISPPDQSPLGFPELHIFEISNNNFSGSISPNYFVNWKASSIHMNGYGSIYMAYEKITSGIIDFVYHDTIDLQYKGLFMENKEILSSYSTIDFSGNRLEGQIPESIGLLKTLIALNLSNNAFTGHIPLSLSNFTELESLDLSRNQLSGTIPDGIKTLSFLEYINVSYNQLKGEIPQGTQIIGQSKSSFEGNAGLCGLPLEETCIGSNAPPTQHSKAEDDEEEQVLNLKAMAIGYGPGFLFGLAIRQVIGSFKPEWLVKIFGLCKHRNR